MTLGVFVEFKYSYDSTLESELLSTQHWATHKSSDIDYLFTEKVETATTLGNTPLFKDALIKSNLSLAGLSEDQRKQFINLENNKWKSSDPSDSFILKFIDNSVSQVLKNQQTLFEGKYGEIFLTNKYGALIASTAKLSTYAHGHKYWWLGAYNQGAGAVFLDDRGYDDSVGGYVLGIVIPIKDGNEVIGILKSNLNILGDLGDQVIGTREHISDEYMLVRSGGLVVAEKGVEPLSTRISETMQKIITLNQSGSFIENVSGAEKIIGFSEVSLSKENGKLRFGGSFESIDHKKGNLGESWYIICKRPLDEVMAPIYESYQSSLKIGISIIFVLVIVSFLYGRAISKPLTLINNATIRVRDGNFDARVKIKSSNEFGSLADHFNIMVEKIGQMTQDLTDSNVNLENRVEERTVALSDSNQSLLDEISERKQAENMLREANARHTAMIENIGDVIVIMDVDGITKYQSPNIERWFGWKPEDLIGTNGLEKVHPEDIERIQKELINVLKEETASTYEFRFLCKDGNYKWIELTAVNRINDPVINGLLLNYHDITERKQAEEALRQSQEQLHLVMHQSPNVFELYDLDGLQIDVNKAYEDLWGFPASHTVNKFNVLKSQEVVDSGLIDPVQRAYSGETVEVGDYVYDPRGETEAQGKGRVRWLNTKIYPLKDVEGKVRNIVITNEDVTERKQAEEQLAESDNLKELLLDIITHDLRNPAASIFSFSEIAQKSSPGNKIIDLIHSSSERLIKVLESTTALTHATFGEKVPKVELNLFDCVAEVVDDLKISIQTSKMELELDIPKRLKVLANPLITEIFNNYISNATKYARDGKKIIIEAAEKNESVIISVKDFGKTIPEEDRMRVFERNVQLAKENKRGHGLGLAIVKRIAAAHDGEVWVEPNSPRGNSFCLRIPR